MTESVSADLIGKSELNISQFMSLNIVYYTDKKTQGSFYISCKTFMFTKLFLTECTHYTLLATTLHSIMYVVNKKI